MVEASNSLSERDVDVVVSDLLLEAGEAAILGHDCAARGIPTLTLSGNPFHPGRPPASAPPALLEKPFRFDDLRGVLDAVRRLQLSRTTAAC